MEKAKISSKNQIVIPAKVRERLNLKQGNSVVLYAIDDNSAILWKEPKKGGYVESMRGLGKEVWSKLGGVDKYLKQERDSWDK